MHNRAFISLTWALLVLMPLAVVSTLQLTQLLLKQSREQRQAAQTPIQLIIDPAAVEWEEEGRELKVGGRYFDVRSLKKAGGMLVLQGYYDDTETAVWQLLNETMRQLQANSYQLILLFQALVPLLLIRFRLTPPPPHRCWLPAQESLLPTPPVIAFFAPPRSAALSPDFSY